MEPGRLGLTHCFPLLMPFFPPHTREAEMRKKEVAGFWKLFLCFAWVRVVLTLLVFVCLGCRNKNTTDRVV